MDVLASVSATLLIEFGQGWTKFEFANRKNKVLFVSFFISRTWLNWSLYDTSTARQNGILTISQYI